MPEPPVVQDQPHHDQPSQLDVTHDQPCLVPPGHLNMDAGKVHPAVRGDATATLSCGGMPAGEATSAASASSLGMPVARTRSGRTVRLPQRFHDYDLSSD